MHRKITLALDPTILPKDFKAAVKQEWKEDSEGKEGLDRERFDWCWCESADQNSPVRPKSTKLLALSQSCSREPETQAKRARTRTHPNPGQVRAGRHVDQHDGGG